MWAFWKTVQSEKKKAAWLHAGFLFKCFVPLSLFLSSLSPSHSCEISPDALKTFFFNDMHLFICSCIKAPMRLWFVINMA